MDCSGSIYIHITDYQKKKGRYKKNSCLQQGHIYIIEKHIYKKKHLSALKDQKLLEIPSDLGSSIHTLMLNNNNIQDISKVCKGRPYLRYNSMPR